MNEEILVRYMTGMAYATVSMSAPPLLTAALVGFTVALFQGVTQIQDQSLPMTLKIITVGAVFLIFGGVLARPVLQLADEIMRVFPLITR